MSSPPRQRPRSPIELQALIALQRKAQPFLVYHRDDGRQVLFELSGRPSPITLGRAAEADLPLPWDEQVSRFHAQLDQVGNDWAIVDDGLSTNGTFVNGRRISGRRRLTDQDVVRVGMTSLTFRHPTPPRDTTTVKAQGTPTIEDVSPTQRRVLIALCRPYKHTDFATPATNQQIADELFLSVDAVKSHLRVLSRRFGLDDLGQNRKRTALAELALEWGLVTRSEL